MRSWSSFTFVLAILLIFASPAKAQTVEPKPSPKSLVIQPDEVAADVIVHGQDVIVLGRVTGVVLVLGGDATIAGRVEGDAAIIGGSLVQRDGGFIGGNVVVMGGRYEPGVGPSLRRPEATTVVIAEYGDDLRELFQRPWRSLLIPRLTAFYLGQRLLSLLFYFLLALLLLAIVPTQLMRAIDALKTRYLSISLIGLVGLLLTGWLMMLAVQKLPLVLATSILLFVIVIMLGMYLFGSLVVHLLVGRWVQHWLSRGRDRSNINALLYALALLAIVFSVPVIGILVWIGMAILSFGITLAFPFGFRQTPAGS
jgi:hypothetical protein